MMRSFMATAGNKKRPIKEQPIEAVVEPLESPKKKKKSLKKPVERILEAGA
jgi:hypothetical protein